MKLDKLRHYTSTRSLSIVNQCSSWWIQNKRYILLLLKMMVFITTLKLVLLLILIRNSKYLIFARWSMSLRTKSFTFFVINIKRDLDCTWSNLTKKTLMIGCSFWNTRINLTSETLTLLSSTTKVKAWRNCLSVTKLSTWIHTLFRYLILVVTRSLLYSNWRHSSFGNPKSKAFISTRIWTTSPSTGKV